MIVLRRFLTALALAFATLGSGANPQAPNSPAKAPAAPATKHCLWEVRGSSNTVFLVGSMHLMKPDMYPLADEIEAAYRRAATVVFETDLAAMESPEFARKMMAQATYPEGETLKKHLSASNYSLLVSSLENAAVGIETLGQFKPWMAAMTLAVVELQRQGFDPRIGVDKHYHNRAVKDGKKLDPLEAPEFQMNLLTSLTDQESEEILEQTLRDVEIWKTKFAELARAWTSGDTKSMDQLVTDNFRDFPKLQKKFVADRNRSWVGTIEKHLRGPNDVFVIVGAAHLVGKDSVVDLLTKNGFKVEQR